MTSVRFVAVLRASPAPASVIRPILVAAGASAVLNWADPAEMAGLTAGSAPDETPIVLVDGSADELWGRCQKDSRHRPLRQDFEQFRQLYDTRRPSYLRASLRVETCGKDIETIAAGVIDTLRLR